MLFRGILQGLNRVYFRQYSIIINFLLRRTVFPPFYVKGIEASKANAGGLEADSYGNGSKSTEANGGPCPWHRWALIQDLLAKETSKSVSWMPVMATH